MTLLVTGSAGHLGEALMRTLRAAGRPARGLDRLASPWTDAVGSIGDPAFVARAMEARRACSTPRRCISRTSPPTAARPSWTPTSPAR